MFIHDICGLERAKRGVEIAIVGGHSYAVVGPRLCGGTSLLGAYARAFGTSPSRSERVYGDVRDPATLDVLNYFDMAIALDASAIDLLLPPQCEQQNETVKRVRVAQERRPWLQYPSCACRHRLADANEMLGALTEKPGTAPGHLVRLCGVALSIAALDDRPTFNGSDVVEAATFLPHVPSKAGLKPADTTYPTGDE